MDGQPSGTKPTRNMATLTKVKGRRFSVCRPVPGGGSSAHHRKSGKYGDYHEIRVKMMTSVNEKSHGSLFLRVGALAFGLGTLIYTGLEFLTFFEVPKTCIRYVLSSAQAIIDLPGGDPWLEKTVLFRYF